MFRSDSQFKKMIYFKYLILETPYTLSLYSAGILVLHTLNTISPMFSGINNNFLFWLFQPFLFCACFYDLLKESIYFQILLALI